MSSKYTINFINASYRRFWKEHRKEILKGLDNCGSKGELILREEVSKLERRLAKYVGVKYGIGVNSGTDALFISLLASGIKSGDEVITVGNAFIAPIQAIKHTGATPVLIDVGDDGLMNETLIERAINKKTKAIIPIHLSGKVCNMDEIMKIAKKHKLIVIEDTCQALGARYDNRMAGSIGLAGCVSFNTPKLLGGIGDGGMILTNDKKLAEKAFLLRNHWNIYQGSVRKEDFPQPEIMNWGWKSRLDNIQASFLNVKLTHYPKMLKRRREIAMMYNKALCDLDKFTLPLQQAGQVYQEYIIKFDDKKEKENFCEYLQKKGIEVLTRDVIPNHKLKGLGMENFKLPITERDASLITRLPIYPELTNNEVNRIISAIYEYYGV